MFYYKVAELSPWHQAEVGPLARKHGRDATSFGFLLENEESCEFTSQLRPQLALWVDGLRHLAGDRSTMAEPEFIADLQRIEELDLKVQLLPFNGLVLPQQAPLEPPRPADFAFATTSADDAISA
jgi:hypothetical protein